MSNTINELNDRDLATFENSIAEDSLFVQQPTNNNSNVAILDRKFDEITNIKRD